ncbi:caspase family protein [Roseimaritima ulvae]|uniref:Caspase domain protein n=1 Tax=Roseimaritima ulvae TaxID=980254 RepID=A0A5B9R649_9BACT|nr:caspase family protein [Roseimaritima ulvae]QEG41981.1 Caspase domain protein [Roseimaritima ulvae]
MADKAFLTGINDYKNIGDLRGCINDTASIRKLLLDQFGFKDANIRIRTDDEVTKAELNKGWKWLLKNAKPDDRLVFHFSGHGSYTADTDDEEPDFQDELLCLYGMDWHDPKTYLLDDELRVWTEQIPEGVQVTFVLDCCHSGTGTRMVEPKLSRAVRTDFRSAAPLAIEDVAIERALKSGATRSTRGLDDHVRKQVRPVHQEDIGLATVLARFARPPANFQIAIDNAKHKRSFRSVLKQAATRSAADQEMNHVLWSGCRDNQTSADAHIAGDYHGAFTYYFCNAVRELGRGARASDVITSLRTKLSEQHFQQLPQLEPEGYSGIVFGSAEQNTDVSLEEPPSDVGDDGGGGGGGINVSAADWQQMLAILQQIAANLSGEKGAAQQRAGSRGIVFVHGICAHDAGYSDPWWESLRPHLSSGVRDALAANRKEVLWSRHVTDMDRAAASAADPVEIQQLEWQLRAVLSERMTQEASQQIVERAAGETRAADIPPGTVRAAGESRPVPRAVLGIPGVDCVDDFVKYLSIDSVRQAVLGECTSVLRPLLQQGQSIELVSHSWGTVVAFEALRELDREGLSGRVHNWFTLGAALAISFVADRLRPRDGRKPTLVDRWINLDARGDGVGGSLQATNLQVDEEYLRLAPVGCRSFLGLVSPACAHSSYFQASNTAVNRDILARQIERA